MSMRSYINAACEPGLSRRVALSVGTGFEHYEDEPAPRPQKRGSKPQARPSWLMKGLQQYLELIDEEGNIAPRDPNERFGHLAASAQPGERASFFGVRSDALYIPTKVSVASGIGGAALTGEDCFVVQTSFSLGERSGETPAIKPRLTLDLLRITDDSARADIILAARARGHREVSLSEEVLDPIDDSGNLPNLLARVKSGIKTPKTDPQITGPVVKEQKDGRWGTPLYPGNAIGGLLKATMSPVLDERITRVPLEAPVPVPTN